MPINLYNPLIKEFFKYLGWPLLFIALWFNGCSDDNKSLVTETVTFPKTEGNFEAKKPVNTPAKWPEKDQKKPLIKWKEKEILVENPINMELANNYVMAKDSIERLKLYIKSIQLNKFSTKFEDDNLTLNIDGIVQGEVKEITPSYVIKAKEIPIQIKQKETVFRLLGGIEVGNNTQLNDFKVKANLMFQNRKGNIISGSLDTQQTIWLGYNVSIFNVKR
jgi:hypothetical protein